MKIGIKTEELKLFDAKLFYRIPAAEGILFVETAHLIYGRARGGELHHHL